MKEFDYYIFIDYSEKLIGYLIIEKLKVKEIISKIVKFEHYSSLKNKAAYIHSIKRIIETRDINSDIFKKKIVAMRNNLEIYSEILEFIKKHNNCIIFISIDNHEFPKFKKLVNITDCEKTKVVQESQLKKDTPEYKMSLILDTFLNIERLKHYIG